MKCDRSYRRDAMVRQMLADHFGIMQALQAAGVDEDAASSMALAEVKKPGQYRIADFSKKRRAS